METNSENAITEHSKSKSNRTKIGGSSDEKEEKAPDSSENGGGVHKTKTSKAKKRKKPKDLTAPRQPLTGYVRYLNDRRETVRAANPNLPFAEITRILASEWSNLPADKKQQYLDAAIQDKERYTKEYNAYKQTQAYKSYTKQISEKKFKENKEENKMQISNNSMVPRESHDDADIRNCDIPIFTEEFLDHNKTRDAELRQLRKSNADYEQQNAILQKHIENVKNAIEKLENEILQQRKSNKSLQQHLDHLRTTLINGFANLKLPGMDEKPNGNSIDNYMSTLHSILLENSNQDLNLIQSARNIVTNLEFKG